MKPLKVGMIGVGGFGGYRRARMRETGLFNLAAVTDRNPEALRAVAEEEKAQAFGDYDEMLRASGLEAIVISTGADSHASLAIKAMRAGLHVFVEKPLCTSLQEVHGLLEAQRETGRVVGVGHSHEPSSPVHRAVKQFIAEDRLGTVACYEKNSSHSGGLEIKPGDWRGVLEGNPGGMLFQCGVHSLHTLCELFGPIEAVQSMMRYDVHPGTQTADVANVLVRHKSGLIGTVNCYHITAYIHELRVFGTKGNLYLDTHTEEGWYQERRCNEVETREAIEMPTKNPGDASANLREWHRAIREGGPTNPSLQHGINAVLPVFAAERAAREGREVALDEMG